jgi:hypothetical protein
MLHEILPTDIADTFSQRWKLDDMITQCRDAAKTFRAASAIPSAHREELMAISRRRSAFAHRLSGFARDPDGANTRGSLAGLARRYLFDTRARLLGQSHLGDSLAACLRADAKAASSHSSALDIEWNGDIADVLEKQRDELATSLSRVRALRAQL